jgi:hypothetical protein
MQISVLALKNTYLCISFEHYMFRPNWPSLSAQFLATCIKVNEQNNKIYTRPTAHAYINIFKHIYGVILYVCALITDGFWVDNLIY